MNNGFLIISIFLLLLLLGSNGILGFLYWRLRRNANTQKAALEASLESLQQKARRTQKKLEDRLQTTTADLQTTQLEKTELETARDALIQQCSLLRDRLTTESKQTQQDSQDKAFSQIQTLLTQYPTLRKMAIAKPDLPAKNLVATLTHLDNLVQYWGYEAIGQPWEKVTYDPQRHQSDQEDIQPKESVYIRFVGYQQINNGQIILPAKVSRTLPAALSSQSSSSQQSSTGEAAA